MPTERDLDALLRTYRQIPNNGAAMESIIACARSLEAERDAWETIAVLGFKYGLDVTRERDTLQAQVAGYRAWELEHGDVLGKIDALKAELADAAELVDQADNEHANDISVVVSQRKALSAANALIAESADEKTLLQAKVDVAEKACALHEDVAKRMAVRLNEMEAQVDERARAALKDSDG